METNTVIEAAVDAFVAKHLVNNSTLTKLERKEVSNLALGLSCKDAAVKENIGCETIRVRRKSIYRKLDVAGHTELVAGILNRLSMTCEVPGPSEVTATATICTVQPIEAGCIGHIVNHGTVAPVDGEAV